MNKHKFYGAFLAFATVASISMGAQAEIAGGLVVQNGYGGSRTYAYCSTATLVDYQCYSGAGCTTTTYNCNDYRNDYSSPGGLYGWVWRTCQSLCAEPTPPVAQPINPGTGTPTSKTPIAIAPPPLGLPTFDVVAQAETVF